MAPALIAGGNRLLDDLVEKGWQRVTVYVKTAGVSFHQRKVGGLAQRRVDFEFIIGQHIRYSYWTWGYRARKKDYTMITRDPQKRERKKQRNTIDKSATPKKGEDM